MKMHHALIISVGGAIYVCVKHQRGGTYDPNRARVRLSLRSTHQSPQEKLLVQDKHKLNIEYIRCL